MCYAFGMALFLLSWCRVTLIGQAIAPIDEINREFPYQVTLSLEQEAKGVLSWLDERLVGWDMYVDLHTQTLRYCFKAEAEALAFSETVRASARGLTSMSQKNRADPSEHRKRFTTGLCICAAESSRPKPRSKFLSALAVGDGDVISEARILGGRTGLSGVPLCPASSCARLRVSMRPLAI